MSDKKIRLRIVTPTTIKYDNDVDMVIMRGTEGDLGILSGHAPMATALAYGVLRVIDEEDEIVFSVMGGFAEVSDSGVTVLADSAERPEEIDRERALEAKRRAERMMSEMTDHVDVRKAELALRRALVRIEVSSYPIIRNRGTSK